MYIKLATQFIHSLELTHFSNYSIINVFNYSIGLWSFLITSTLPMTMPTAFKTAAPNTGLKMVTIEAVAMNKPRHVDHCAACLTAQGHTSLQNAI